MELRRTGRRRASPIIIPAGRQRQGKKNNHRGLAQAMRRPATAVRHRGPIANAASASIGRAMATVMLRAKIVFQLVRRIRQLPFVASRGSIS
jgi:hypothetical protein